MSKIPAKLVPSISFGDFIAFLLPGVPLLRGAAYFSTSLEKVWELVVSGEAGFGVFVSLFLFVLTAGLCASSVRSSIEFVIIKIFPSLAIDYTKLNKEKLELFNEAIKQVYRHAQFTGNMAIAFWILFVGYIEVPSWKWDVPTTMILISSIVLTLAAVCAFLDTREKFRALLQ